MKKFLLGIFLCVLSVGAAFAAMSNDEFFELCKTGTPRQVQTAIKSGANVNARDKYGWTPLMFAAGINSNPKVITALINAGADINVRNKDGFTPLMLAATFNSNPEIITALIKAGADLNARDKDGKTPLMLAVWNNYRAPLSITQTSATDPVL